MAIAGAILGDIAGSFLEENRKYIVEFNPEINWETYPFFKDDCMFTDDTVTTLAIKKAIDLHLPFKDTIKEIGLKYPYCGWGHHFNYWLHSEGLPYGSWGNGSAMRVSYIGEYFNTLEEVQKIARISAEISHNSYEGIKGAVVTATCIWMAKNDYSKDDILNYVISEYNPKEYKFSVNKPLSKIRKKYKWSISCQDSVPIAVRCFYESKDFMSFLVNVASLDCDSDTIGAIGGGIAEEFYKCTIPNQEEIIKQFLSPELYDIYKSNYERT